MVFPSRGCITCKTRRIKCDSVRPVCSRCQKADRACTWDENEEAGLLFKNENAFAEGKPRRPWKPRDREEVTKAPGASGMLEAAERVEEAYPLDIVAATPITWSPPAEDEAFHFWVKNYLFRDDEIPEFAREHNHYLLAYRERARPDSSLHLAIYAFSHAVFGRAMQVGKMINDANDVFPRIVARIEKEFDELSQDNYSELLLTTMLMAFYENITYVSERRHSQELDSPLSSNPDATGSRFWQDVCHHEGAAAILKIRQGNRWAPNLPLERAARRQIIRTCILRGTPVAEWLEDGSQFGEEKGPVLDLDSIMVRVAALRAESMVCFLPKSARFSSELHPGDIVAEARDLDADLDSWSRSIPGDWRFSTKASSKPDFTYGGSFHVFATHGHAALWNRSRAMHLVVNSIRRRALVVMAQCALANDAAKAEQEVCLEKMALIATDLCRGVSFFLASLTTAQDAESWTASKTSDNYEILPKLAALLAWPLTLGISTDGVPQAQKDWLTRRLKSVARALGDAMLDEVIEQGEFKF